MLQLNFCQKCGTKRVRDVKEELQKLFGAECIYKSDLCAICFQTLKKNSRKRRTPKKLAVSEIEERSSGKLSENSLDELRAPVKLTVKNEQQEGVALERENYDNQHVGYIKLKAENREPFGEEGVEGSASETINKDTVNVSQDDDDTDVSGCEDVRITSKDASRTTKGMRSDYESVFADLDIRVREFMTKSHDPKQHFQCKFCDKKFAYIVSFTRHIRIHPGAELIDKPFKCHLCEAGFNRRYNLKTHGNKHSDFRPFKCSFPPCKAAFKDKHTLAGHENSHTGTAEKPYQCQYCSKLFRKSNSLMMHIRTHTGDKPFKCKFCGFCCSQKQNLVTHERRHIEDKPYRCKICSQGFYQSTALQYHQMDHTGYRPYICEVCGYSCKSKGFLKQHMPTHKPDKPYKCDKCTFTSKRKESLTAHQTVHTTERPFQCNQCTQVFKHKHSMMKHQRRHQATKGIIQAHNKRKTLGKAGQLSNPETQPNTVSNTSATIDGSPNAEELPHQYGLICFPTLHPSHLQRCSSGVNSMKTQPHVTPQAGLQTTRTVSHDYKPAHIGFKNV